MEVEESRVRAVAGAEVVDVRYDGTAGHTGIIVIPGRAGVKPSRQVRWLATMTSLVLRQALDEQRQIGWLAERVGFEPTVAVTPLRFSRPTP